MIDWDCSRDAKRCDSACSTPVTRGCTLKKSRRYLLGLEPFFEGGWLHKGARATRWQVEEHLVALAIFGDVTIDLTEVKILPAQIEIRAYALGRDVDVLVPEGTRVQLVGRKNNGHLKDQATSVTGSVAHSVKIKGHTILGDVTIRTD